MISREELQKFLHYKTSNICRHCCYFRNAMELILDAYEKGLNADSIKLSVEQLETRNHELLEENRTLAKKLSNNLTNNKK